MSAFSNCGYTVAQKAYFAKGTIIAFNLNSKDEAEWLAYMDLDGNTADTTQEIIDWINPIIRGCETITAKPMFVNYLVNLLSLIPDLNR